MKGNGKQRKTRVTKWNLDPELLADPDTFTMVQLLILIRERDPKIPLPETREDAIKILSKDYLGRPK